MSDCAYLQVTSKCGIGRFEKHKVIWVSLKSGFVGEDKRGEGKRDRLHRWKPMGCRVSMNLYIGAEAQVSSLC